MSDEPTDRSSPDARARQMLLMAGGISALGVAIAGTLSRVAGGVVVVVGWLAFLYGLHAFGRTGSPPTPPAAKTD